VLLLIGSLRRKKGGSELSPKSTECVKHAKEGHAKRDPALLRRGIIMGKIIKNPLILLNLGRFILNSKERTRKKQEKVFGEQGEEKTVSILSGEVASLCLRGRGCLSEKKREKKPAVNADLRLSKKELPQKKKGTSRQTGGSGEGMRHTTRGGGGGKGGRKTYQIFCFTLFRWRKTVGLNVTESHFCFHTREEG